MKHTILILCMLITTVGMKAQQSVWLTYYEKSGCKETPRYTETVDYCRRLGAASAKITFTTFGKSAQGRDLPLLILDREGLKDPAAIRAAGRSIVMIQACIHAGECEGKDAGLMLFRDLGIADPSVKKLDPGLLSGISVIFLPIFNTDGHERFGPFNRINQNGPEQMGWRTTANNLNLNRDYLKADSPEMAAWLTLFNTWSPDFFIDCHTTDGADYQYVLTYLMEIYGSMDKELTSWSKNTFIPRMQKHMNQGGFPVFPYVGFRNWHDPRSGLITEVAPPMLSQGYTALRNRPGLLIETHMLKPYKVRVEGTYECLLTSLEIINSEAAVLHNLVVKADMDVSSRSFLETPFPLRFETRRDDSTMVDFLGMKYDIVKSDLSGGDWFQYSKTPETFHIPYFAATKPSKTTRLPYAYIIPAEWTDVIRRLHIHGIRMTTLKQEASIPVTTCRFKNPKWQQYPYEGRHTLTNIEFDEIRETRLFAAGSVVVEVMQPAGRIIPHLLEPAGNGSFVYWGFFDAVFEQKEYGESYVIETMAREMMKKDSALKTEFDQKSAADTAFAHNPQAILNWFYNKSPYSDSRKLIYPVGKIFDAGILDSLRQ